MNTNHHLPESTSGAACDAVAPLLPLVAQRLLEPEEAQAVQEHVAGCDHCRARLAAYDGLDHALRRRFEQIASSPIRMEELMRRVQHEEQYVRREEQSDLIEESPLAPLSIPSAPLRPVRRSPRRVFSWLAAIAAVLVIALITTALFVSHHSSGLAVKPKASATAVPPKPLGVYFDTPFSFDQPHNSVVALHAADGSLLWRHDYSNAAVMVTALQDGVLYAGSTNGYVYAFRASDGMVLWSRQITAHTNVYAVVNGVVYVNADDITKDHPDGNEYVYALDAKTGEPLWHFDKGGISVTGGVSDGLVYVLNQGNQADRTLYALNASDGSVAWTFEGNLLKVVDGIAYVTTTPVVGANMDSHTTLYALDARRGTQLWSFPKADSLLMAGAEHGLTYLVSNDGQGDQPPNVLYALNTSDGSVQWRVLLPVADVNSLLLTAGVWYIDGYNHVVYAFDTMTGSQLWSTQLATVARPLFVADGRLYACVNQFSSAENLYALDAGTGAVQWQQNIVNGFLCVRQAINGVLYGGGEVTDGLKGTAYVYALNAGDGSVKWRYLAGEDPLAGSFSPLIG